MLPDGLSRFLKFAPADEVAANEAHARSLGLRKVEFRADGLPFALAICGGGPSLAGHVSEIKEFPVVFAINGAYRFLVSHGVDATIISVDHDKAIADFCRGARRAIVATRCAPEVFAALDASAAWVRVFEVPGDVAGASSTASTFIEVASRMGFRKVTFFGCESCFKDRTHAYGTDASMPTITVRADGREFTTRADYYLQAREISTAIREHPGAIRERSGGLLRAMVRDPRFAIVQEEVECLST